MQKNMWWKVLSRDELRWCSTVLFCSYDINLLLTLRYSMALWLIYLWLLRELATLMNTGLKIERDQLLHLWPYVAPGSRYPEDNMHTQIHEKQCFALNQLGYSIHRIQVKMVVDVYTWYFHRFNKAWIHYLVNILGLHDATHQVQF